MQFMPIYWMPLAIGVDTMDVKAACRTYNILMAEGRKVAALLLIENAGESVDDSGDTTPTAGA